MFYLEIANVSRNSHQWDVFLQVKAHLTYVVGGKIQLLKKNISPLMYFHLT